MAGKIHITLVNKPFKGRPLAACVGANTIDLCTSGQDLFVCAAVPEAIQAKDDCFAGTDSGGCCAYHANAKAYDNCQACDYASCWTTAEWQDITDDCGPGGDEVRDFP